MSTREFTYNTGSAISGTDQLEDLAVGVTDQAYYQKPGDALWWMGPNEVGKVIIAKDVPSQDHISPVGDIGNVEFWGGDYSEETFIEIASKVPERLSAGLPPFDTDAEAITWLNANGYWTNYVYNPPATNPWFAALKGYKFPPNTSLDYGHVYLSYSTSQDTVYAWDYIKWTTSYANAVFEDVSSLTADEIRTVSATSDYLPTAGGVGPGQTVIDETNNKLFLNAGTRLLKYSIPANTIDANVAVQNGLAGHNINRPIFEDSTSRVYLADGQYLKIYAASNLSQVSVINMASIQAGLGGSALVNDTVNNKVIVCSRTRFGVFNPSTLAFDHIGSISGFADDPKGGVYSPTSEKVYFGGTSGSSPRIAIIDMSDYSVTYRTFFTGGSNNINTTLAYDPIRNSVWGMNSLRNICQLKCSDSTVTHYNTKFAGTWLGVMPQTANDLLYIGSRIDSNVTKAYRLNDFDPV